MKEARLISMLQNPKWKVLLIEAGDAESYLMDIPILANMLQFTNANWKYKSTPNNRSCLGKPSYKIIRFTHITIKIISIAIRNFERSF